MTFADRSILTALVALAIPLAIHLLGRRRARKIVLPTTRFAEGAHHAARGVLWLKRAALLASRLAAVALLVLALAGPQLGGPPAAGGPCLVCLDTSPSMRVRETEGRSRLDAARARLLEIVSALPGDAPATLLVPGGSAGGDTAAQVCETLRGPTPAGWAEEPLHRMIGRAAAMIAKAGGTAGANVVIATDATPWALRDLGPGRFKDLGADVTILAAGAPVRNTWLGLPETRVADSPQGRSLGVTVAARRGEPQEQFAVFLRLDGRAETHAALVRPGSTTARFSLPVSGDGPWQGRVWTADDALPEDSTRYFTAAARVPIRVLVVDAAGEKDARLRSADLVAAAFAGDAAVAKTVTRLPAAKVNGDALAAADVVFWVGPSGPGDAAAVEALARYVWIPSAPDSPVQGVEEVAEGVTIDPAGYTSDLVAAFEGGTSGDLGAPVLRRRLVLKENGAVALRFRDGAPAALVRVRPNGRAVSLAFGPAPFWGDLAGKAEFVVLVHSLAEALAPSRGVGPRVANVIAGRPDVNDAPGNYALTEAEAKAFVSVNVDPDETADLTPQPDRLAAAFAPDRVRVVMGASASTPKAAASGPAQGPATDLAPLFIVALAAVLAIESLLAAPRWASQAAPAPRP